MATNNEVTGIIELDQRLETDSAFGDELPSDTQSLKSWVERYKFQHGRRYAVYGENDYFLPNDKEEQDRQTLLHEIAFLAMGETYYSAPLREVGACIDLGTGNGEWAIAFGDKHPEAHVTGNDLSPIQPHEVPPNVEFVVDDFEIPWPGQIYDLIHGRFLVGSVYNWSKLVAQAFDHTKPGGWVEFQDWDAMIESDDGSIPKESSLYLFHEQTIARLEAAGLRCNVGRQLESLLLEAGFKRVKAKTFKVPLGTWPKDPRMKQLGRLFLYQFLLAIKSTAIGALQRIEPPIGNFKPWSDDEVEVLLAGVRGDLKDRKYHGYYNFHVVYGQKDPMGLPKP